MTNKHSFPSLPPHLANYKPSKTLSLDTIEVTPRLMTPNLSDSEISVLHESVNKPAILEKGPLRFVITDSPTDSSLLRYVSEVKKLHVKHLCRTNEPSYNANAIESSGVQVHEVAFKDGDPPPDNVLQKWLEIVEGCFLTTGKNSKFSKFELKNDERLGVHCVAGLGRAPVLVAVALVEFCDMSAEAAVDFIRKHRRGAINKKQVMWLQEYVPRRKVKQVECSCVIC